MNEPKYQQSNLPRLLYAWHDAKPHERDESTAHVLPKHLLLLLWDMAGSQIHIRTHMNRCVCRSLYQNFKYQTFSVKITHSLCVQGPC